MTAGRQLRALVALRWQMVRSTRTRRGLIVLAATMLLLITAVALIGRLLPSGLAVNAALLTPTAYAGFAVLALVSPLAAGGGNELFPADQVSAYPIRPATMFLASLALAPLNLAWLSQVLLLTALTGGITTSAAGMPVALLTTYAYVTLVTVTGQALAWLVVGIRQSRTGRIGMWALAAAIGLTVGLVVQLGYTITVLDRLPTAAVAVTVLRGGSGAYLQWAAGFVPLLLGTVLAALLGTRACDWALRRPGSGTRRLDRTMRRRSPARSAFLALLATDRRSVWRSTSLRRGALVLILLPAAAAFGLQVSWDSLVLLPGLVAAGSALLFGVNAFCLDASGAVWLASLPHRPDLAALAKAWIIGETCLLAITAVILGGVLRVQDAPTVAQITAVAATTVCCTLWVCATCLKLSVDRPHRADLRGARDAPAPPGSMAVYSARLALSTTLIGLTMSLAAAARVWTLPILVGLPILLLAVRSLLRNVRRYKNLEIRTRVIQTVAAG
ncbi:MAG: hypothetical protein DLM59_08360 [Pseudonocardiales bacterium]|nr:MAG: hypothetical protein DLM59_08360 [Pseudonocardiales bacterium]